MVVCFAPLHTLLQVLVIVELLGEVWCRMAPLSDLRGGQMSVRVANPRVFIILHHYGTATLRVPALNCHKVAR